MGATYFSLFPILVADFSWHGNIPLCSSPGPVNLQIIESILAWRRSRRALGFSIACELLVSNMCPRPRTLKVRFIAELFGPTRNSFGRLAWQSAQGATALFESHFPLDKWETSRWDLIKKSIHRTREGHANEIDACRLYTSAVGDPTALRSCIYNNPAC